MVFFKEEKTFGFLKDLKKHLKLSIKNDKCNKDIYKLGIRKINKMRKDNRFFAMLWDDMGDWELEVIA